MAILNPAVLAVAITSVAFAQTISITGKVTDTGLSPLSAAAVKLEKSGLTAMTGLDGVFTLSGTVNCISPHLQLQNSTISVTKWHGS